MPVYEYRCPTCGQTFEKLMRLGSTELPPCPSCGTREVKRLISAAARLATDCGPSGGG